MNEVERTAEDGAPWQYGDVVIDDTGYIWSRADDEDVARGWPWAHGATQTVRAGHPIAGEGSVEESAPVRPLTLLVRNGKPVNTIVVSSDNPAGQ
ncbi:hypothetical protein FEK35_27500 [Nocardia cyriacigeorgica]|uniref:Uncharacterized protein n=1 Tax=Nocardia cyriacigeorgica TaxID=135487 RepID=A0A5R8P685_9NOCA|nr:hypothetical protein [Nocardia cyriacigeorgica]TLF96837.1 hypothetical protein FEK35_27500 [Nocardia cyriacigeorgica]